MSERVVHPGPPLTYDRLVAPASAEPISLNLKGGDVMLPALARELGALGLDSAYLEFADASVTRFDFVLPHWPSPDGRRVAWYSDTHHLDTPGTIKRLALFYGRKDGEPFIHGHGTWCDRSGTEFFGHVLADSCVLEQSTVAAGYGLTGARFEVMDCAETEFSVFHPVATASTDEVNALLVRLAPNSEIGEQLGLACSDAGWKSARAYGIGSLVAAHFQEGAPLESKATEFAVEGVGKVSALADVELDIRVIGVGGPARQGRLARGENHVLITSEFLLIADSCH